MPPLPHPQGPLATTSCPSPSGVPPWLTPAPRDLSIPDLNSPLPSSKPSQRSHCKCGRRGLMAQEVCPTESSHTHQPAFPALPSTAITPPAFVLLPEFCLYPIGLLNPSSSSKSSIPTPTSGSISPTPLALGLLGLYLVLFPPAQNWGASQRP